MASVIDMLSSLIGGGSTGKGLASQAADVSRFYPQYQQELISAQSEGMPFPPFEQWLVNNGLLQEVRGVLPR